VTLVRHLEIDACLRGRVEGVVVDRLVLTFLILY
jgi:hypothetical protein